MTTPKRAAPAVAVPTTIAIPPIAVPEVHVHLPAPRFVWSDSDDATVTLATGMKRSSFMSMLSAMNADPTHAHRVLVLSRKRRGVEVEHFALFLHERFGASARPREPASDEGDAPPSGVDRVLALAECERVNRSEARRRR